MEDRRGGSNGGQQRWVEWRTFEVARMEDRKGGWNGGLRQLYPRTMKVARMEDYNLALMEDTGVGSNGGQWWQLYWKTMEVALMEDCDVALIEGSGLNWQNDCNNHNRSFSMEVQSHKRSTIVNHNTSRRNWANLQSVQSYSLL